GLGLGILAGNVPALAVQVALPALAVGRPVLLKSSRREPLLAAALVHLLTRARPELATAVAAATWPGGDSSLEEELLATARTVVAYGGRAALSDLGRRHDELVGRGPMVSLAVVGRDAAIAPTAAGLARDVALFEQRGCLSVVAVWVEGGNDASEAEAADAMADAVAGELCSLADRWPPPRRDAATLAAVQQMRRDAELRGARVLPLEVAVGSVVSESDPHYRPVPEARFVRVHPTGALERLPPTLSPLAGHVQGVALAGERAWSLAEDLERLGVRRLARPGELQRPDALWANGERHLIEELV
ncbi:MAG: acyl-CoA reductase, partial [Thermoanaerobaculia bacterium]|nr:acyl-CoA reductase [Thermoanaerobaculia bacterium]